MSSPRPRSYQFGPFFLDVVDRRLVRDGEAVPLTAKTFDILLHLVRNAGCLTSKASLLQEVWQGRVVEEGNVAQHVSLLRRALGERGDWIETVPGHGYRFVAPIQEVDGPPASRRRVVGVCALEVLGAAGDEYLGAGIAEGITRRLSRHATLAVRVFRGSVTAGARAEIEALVHGTLRRVGDSVRASIELVDGAGCVLWSEKFDERWADLFALEDAVSRRIADALLPQLSPVPGAATLSETTSADAYRAYLRGRFAWTKRTSEGTRKAIQHFSDSIEEDPGYARAWSGLADCYSQMGWMRYLTPGESFPRARAAARRALELAPELAEAHASSAWIDLVYDCAWRSAERSFRAAVALDPSCFSARMWSSVLFAAERRFDEALDAIAAAQEADPLSPLAATLAGWPHYFRGDHDRARAAYELVLRSHPQFLPARILRAHVWSVTGEPRRAVEDCEAVLAIDDTTFSRAELAAALHRAGEHDQADRVLDGLSWICPFDRAAIAVACSDHERAIAALEDAVRERAPWRLLLPVEPRFAMLHGDPRFARLLRELSS